MTKITLYNYWRSSASWRVRIALAAKRIPYNYEVVNIINGDQKLPKYLDINPNALVPSIMVEGYEKEPFIITQSMAIIDFLENYDNNPILTPKNLVDRVKMLEIVNTIVCDTHPLQNFGVLKTYPSGARKERGHVVISKSFNAIEEFLKRNASRLSAQSGYCVGNNVTLADVVLIPQVSNGITRFDINLDNYPRIKDVYKHLITLEPFIASHPRNQPDTPPEERNCE